MKRLAFVDDSEESRLMRMRIGAGIRGPIEVARSEYSTERVTGSRCRGSRLGRVTDAR